MCWSTNGSNSRQNQHLAMKTQRHCIDRYKAGTQTHIASVRLVSVCLSVCPYVTWVVDTYRPVSADTRAGGDCCQTDDQKYCDISGRNSRPVNKRINASCVPCISYWLALNSYISDDIFFFIHVWHKTQCLQCFDAVGWAAGRASGL